MKNTLITTLLLSTLLFSACTVNTSSNNPNNEDMQKIIAEQVKQGIEDYKKEEEDKVIAEQKLKQQAEEEKKQQELAKAKSASTIKSDDYIRWNKDAPLTLIEYSDYECPFCKRFHATAQQVVDNYPEDVKWIYRHYPLPFHDPIATQESIAAECVWSIWWNDKFWEYTDLIYSTTKSNKWLAESQLPVMAEGMGIDKAEFETCLSSWKFADKVNNQRAEWTAAWVTWTPWSLLVNDATWEIVMIKGAKWFTTIKADIDRMLKK